MVALMKRGARRFAPRRWKHDSDDGIEDPVSEALAHIVVWITGTYLGAGPAFAVVFVTTGVQRIDPVARHGTWGFRVLIVPGVMLLWPLLARRWAVGSIHPPIESNPHRRRARLRAEGA
jgi:hypothetical protein